MASRKKDKPDYRRLLAVKQARRRQIVAMLYLSGNHTHDSIAEELASYDLPCNPATVSRDLKVLKQYWLTSAAQTTQQWQVRELAKLSFIEEVLLHHLTTGQIEADRYAVVMTNMMKRRSNLLGLDAPKQVAISDGRDPHKVSLLTDADLERIIATAYELEGIKLPPTLDPSTGGKIQ